MLLERDAELARLTAVLAQARTGAGATVVIRGPLGVGRTAFLRAADDQARQLGFRTRWAAASPSESDFALGVTLQLLAHADDGPVLTESTVDSAVRALSAEQPLALLVDDLHWSDELSLKALGRLVCQLGSLPVTLIVTVRDGDPGTELPLVRDVLDSASVVLRPASLSRAATAEVVARAFGEPGDEEFVRVCHEMTTGSPVALTSVVDDLVADGMRPLAGEISDLLGRRPESVLARLVSCVRALPAATRSVAAAVAVLGEDVERETVRLLACLDPIGWDEAVRQLTMLGLCTDEPRLRFVHVFFSDAVNHVVSTPDREVLHLRAAELLHDRHCPAEQIAVHLLAVSGPLDDWAIDLLREASTFALGRGAPEIAARYLRRAVSALPDDSVRRARLLVDLAVATRDIDLTLATRHLAQALPLLDSARERAAALMRLTPSLLDAPRQPVTHQLVRDVAAELGDVDALTGDERDLALRLEARIRFVGIDDPNTLASSARRLSELDIEPGFATEAERELLTVLLHSSTLSARITAADALRLAKGILAGQPPSPAYVHSAFPLLVKVFVAAESLDDVSAWLDVASGLAEGRFDQAIEFALIDADRALVRVYQDRIADAVVLATNAANAPVPDWTEVNSNLLQTLTGVATRCRDRDLCRLVMARCVSHAPADVRIPHTLRLLRAVLLDGENHSGTLSHLMEFGRTFDRLGKRNPVLAGWRAWAARLHHELGDRREAERLAGEQCQLAEAWGAAGAHARALHLLGEVTEGARGVELQRDAIDLLESSGQTGELARALWSLANRLRAEGLPGHEQAAARARRLALNDGEHSASPAPAARATASMSNVPTLTDGERQIAELVAAGRTNAEIAEVLKVSRRAVEKHLTSCYRKLGLADRTALVEVFDTAARRVDF